MCVYIHISYKHVTYMHAYIHILLYNILLPINCYTGNITTKHHSKNTSDNGDLTGTFHQKISSFPVGIASDSRYFQSS